MTSFSPATNNVAGRRLLHSVSVNTGGIGALCRWILRMFSDNCSIVESVHCGSVRAISAKIHRKNARKTLRLVIPSAIRRTQNSAGGRPSAPCSLAYRNTVQWEEGVPWRLKRRIRASARTWRTFWIKFRSELGRGPPVRAMQPGVQEYCTMGRGCSMAIETTYTSLRQNLANVLDQIVDQQETVVVRRRGARDVALIPAAELAGLIETAHLLRSPRNARRLLAALRRAEQGKTKPVSVAVLRREMLGATGK